MEAGGAVDDTPGQNFWSQFLRIFSCQKPPLPGAILIDDFPILSGFLRAGSRGVPDNLADTLDARHTGCNLLPFGGTALFSLVLLQRIGLWLGQATILGLVRGEPAGFEGAVIQEDKDTAQIRS